MSETTNGAADKTSNGNEPHQHQAGSTTHRQEDQWKHRAPYRIHDDPQGFDVKWKGKCHCGAVQYQLSRDKPLSSKYCHCTTCQRLHGAPFQWAAIFHKEDVNFTRGIHDLGWYDPSNKSTSHHLPCKVQCAYCRTPIMDEGRNMILLFPTLIEGINTDKGRQAFAAQCHMFYTQRVVDIRDGLPKFKGLSDQSPLINENTGHEIPGSDTEQPDKKRQRTED
ncbi:Mss4-like protein [Podospora didyma]|uniref:Mss4-like protein n=1 Tax=Podospora didyma TaxID=330526 RepID=A0AAE0TZP0_9PEZI|nr:Mss4-like protein [Podospora didyma]